MITSNSFTARYLGRLEFTRALAAQDAGVRALHAGAAGGVILGFETEPVITLGLRATDADVTGATLPTVRVDRGGRATLHQPGQLVIFPVVALNGLGSRAWVERLIEVTRVMAHELGHPLTWREDQPGLHDARGKVVAIGLRIRRGISTHGLAINVRNELDQFAQIRACGLERAPVARLRTDLSLEHVFERWVSAFRGAIP